MQKEYKTQKQNYFSFFYIYGTLNYLDIAILHTVSLFTASHLASYELSFSFFFFATGEKEGGRDKGEGEKGEKKKN